MVLNPLCILNPDSKRIPKSAVTDFITKYKIKLRHVQRKCGVHKESFALALMRWHCTLREGLIKTGNDKHNFNQKWGRFKPEQRLNVYQVPPPFVIDCKTTYEVNIPKEHCGKCG